MAHGDTALLAERPETEAATSNGVVASLKSFAARHQEAKAIIEYAGRRGARIVLIGENGAGESQLVASTDVARQVCASAGVPVENTWEQELNEQMSPAADLWRSVSRRTLVR